MNMSNTFRYCNVCKKNRVFQMNPFLGHSECVDCGSRFAGVVNERQLFATELVSHIENRIGSLISHKKQTDAKTLKFRIEELQRFKKYLLREYGQEGDTFKNIGGKWKEIE